jgi:hypothetical protein
VDFLDCAKVVDGHERVCVPADSYHNVLVIDESNPMEEESVAGHQRKLYSKRTGLVQVKPVGGEEQEFLDLVQVKKLSRPELKSIKRPGVDARQPRLHRQQGCLRQDTPAVVANSSSHSGRSPRGAR